MLNYFKEYLETMKYTASTLKNQELKEGYTLAVEGMERYIAMIEKFKPELEDNPPLQGDYQTHSITTGEQ